MITPLGQRQILQTLAVETVRLAMEGGAQIQREQAQRQSFNAQLAEAMLDVVDVADSEALKPSEHGEQQSNGQGEAGTGASGETVEEDEPVGESSAEGAGPHVDLLA